MQKLHWRTTVVLLQGHSILKNWQFDCLLQQWPGLYKLLKDLRSRHSSIWCALYPVHEHGRFIALKSCTCQDIMQQLPCPGHHASTAMPRASCSYCHAQGIMQQLPCLGHHAATAMPRTSCSNCNAQSIMQQLPCMGHHVATAMRRASCSNCHAQGIM